MDVEGAPEGRRSRVGGGWQRRGRRLQKFKRHPAAALTPFNSAKRRIGIESKLLFLTRKKTVRRKKVLIYMGLVDAFLERLTISLKSFIETQNLS